MSLWTSVSLSLSLSLSLSPSLSTDTLVEIEKVLFCRCLDAGVSVDDSVLHGDL